MISMRHSPVGAAARGTRPHHRAGSLRTKRVSAPRRHLDILAALATGGAPVSGTESGKNNALRNDAATSDPRGDQEELARRAAARRARISRRASGGGAGYAGGDE